MASSSTAGNKFSDTHFHWHVFVCDSWHNFEKKERSTSGKKNAIVLHWEPNAGAGAFYPIKLKAIFGSGFEIWIKIFFGTLFS